MSASALLCSIMLVIHLDSSVSSAVSTAVDGNSQSASLTGESVIAAALDCLNKFNLLCVQLY